MHSDGGGAARRALGGALLVVFLLGGCTHHRDTNEDLDTLLAAYRQQNQRVTESRRAHQERGIELLDVRPGAKDGTLVIDLAVRDAHLGVVVQKLIEASGLDHVVGPFQLGSRTTARFSGRPFEAGLDLLLRPSGLAARIEDGIVILHERSASTRDGSFKEDSEEDEEGDQGEEDGDDDRSGRTAETRLERRLRVADPDRVVEVLDALYPEDEDSGLRAVRFAQRPETASIFLVGTHDEVLEASRLLDRLDAQLDHILLEALVVEFDVGAFTDIGSRIEQGSSGKFGDVFLDVANLVGDTLSFTRVADAASSNSFAAVINLLIQREEARVVSRPWLATLSGSPAELEIAEDRYVLAELPGGFEVSLEEISSGVELKITPVVRVDGSIRLEIEITESQFVPSLDNVEQRRSRNSVHTTAQVGAGESVIIGGLMLNRRGRSTAGIPYLRDIFPFNLVFGHKDFSHEESQVLIYVTPHLWQPGLDLPMAPSAFELYPPAGGDGDTEVTSSAVH